MDYNDDDCPALDERWHLRPDVDTPLRPHIGLLTEPSWQAEDWEELSRNVVVHGWFGTYACEVLTVEDGEVRTRLLERDNAKLVTETTMAALQASGATSPRDPWCEAWIPGQPGKLVAVRFGLDGDRPAPIERELDS